MGSTKMSIKRTAKIVMKSLVIAKKKRDFFKMQTNTFHLPAKLVRKAKRLGFTADEYAIYNLDVNSPSDYVSEFERMLYRDAVIHYRILLDNKIVFYNIIRNFANTNTIYAYKENGIYVGLEKRYEERNIIERLRENKKLVYKKIYVGGGVGFKLLEFEENLFYINRNHCDEREIMNLISQDNYLIEEFCEQSEFENQLYPYSVNTLRLITLEMSNKKYEVVEAFQRMGADKEKCVDNACMGGLYAHIDIKTGTLSAARSHALGRLRNAEGQFVEYKKHPETGSEIEGISIPNWKEIIEEVKMLHKKISFTGIPFIAWDIALTDNGIKVIEANTSCSMDLLQTFYGIRNRVLGNWMKEKGYIK